MSKLVQTNMSFSVELNQRWGNYAKREGISKSEVVRKALEQYLKEREKPFVLKRIPLHKRVKSNTIKPFGQYISFYDRNLATGR